MERQCIPIGPKMTLMQQSYSAYVPVWQTWTLIRPISTAEIPITPMHSNRPHDVRQRVQTARIQRRLTIHELAQRVHCDPEQIAAFERGEEILSDDIQKSVFHELKLQ